MGARRGTRGPALAAVLAAAAGACAGGSHAPARHEIEIRAFVFSPAAQVAQPGDTLVFVNHDAVPHTATATDGSWDTGSIPANGTKAVAVPRAGDYRCAIHPTMTGRVDAAK
ncbi:MAG: copper-binding protein [Longimicrobiaceae bacterium]